MSDFVSRRLLLQSAACATAMLALGSHSNSLSAWAVASPARAQAWRSSAAALQYSGLPNRWTWGEHGFDPVLSPPRTIGSRL